MLQGEAVDRADLVLDVFGVTGFAGELTEPFDQVVDNGERVFGTVDHVEDVHLDLLLLPVSPVDADGRIFLFFLVRDFFCHGETLPFRCVFSIIPYARSEALFVFGFLYKETRGLAQMYIL